MELERFLFLFVFDGGLDMNKIFWLIKSSIIETVQSFCSARGVLVLLALLFFNCEEMHSVVEFANSYNEPIVPVAMPFIFYSLHFQLMFGLVTIFLFSEVPFITARITYTVLRTGRRWWLIGKILRIAITSVLYMVLECIMSIVACGKQLLWINEWGSVWKSLSFSIEAEFLSVSVPRNVLIQYTPLEAMSRVFIIGCLVVTFIGCFMLLISLLISSTSSIVVTGFISAFPYFAVNSAPYYYKIFYFCPISWIGIIEYSSVYIYGGPDSSDMLYILTVMLVVIITILWFIINRVDLKEGKGAEE